jgi:Tol biopolymer transport system component
VWSPTGDRILFQGVRDPNAPSEELFDWWISPLAGGEAIKTGVVAALRRQGLSRSGVPDVWVPGEDRVLFSGRLGDSTNIWQIPLPGGRGRAPGAPQRLTFGTGVETQPSIAGDRLVFSSRSANIDIWSLPIAADEGKVTGDLQRLTQTAAPHIEPRLSADGKTLAFVSVDSGKGDVWLEDLESGKQTALTLTPSNEEQPALSADGSQVAYVVREGGLASIYVVSATGGVPERVCEACALSFTDWSSDGTRMLYLWEHPRRVAVLNVRSGRKTDLLRHPRYHLYFANFSPDGQWITFLAQTDPEHRRLYAVPFRGEVAVVESEWIPLTDGRFSDDKPRLSPDGNLLYFTSNRDGFVCLWAQRLEPATKRPLGSAFPIHHFHSPRLSMANVALGWLGIAVARDRVVFNLGELGGNIWMARAEEKH